MSEILSSSTSFAGVDLSKYSLSVPLQARLMMFTAVTSSLDAIVGYDSQNISSDAN